MNIFKSVAPCVLQLQIISHSNVKREKKEHQIMKRLESCFQCNLILSASKKKLCPPNKNHEMSGKQKEGSALVSSMRITTTTKKICKMINTRHDEI